MLTLKNILSVLLCIQLSISYSQKATPEIYLEQLTFLNDLEREELKIIEGEELSEYLSVLCLQGIKHNEQGEYELAQTFFFTILKFSTLSNLKELELKSYINLGHSYLNQSNYDLALIQYYKALQQADRTGFQEWEGIANNSIGNAFFKQKQYPKALEYYSKAIEIRTANNDTAGLASTYNGIGAIHNKLGDLDQSEKFILKSLELKEQLEDDDGMAVSNKNLGSIYYKRGMFYEAIKYYRKSLIFERKIQKKSGLASSYFNLGISYYSLDDIPTSIIYVDSSLAVSTEIGYMKGVLQAHQALAEIQELNGNTKRALEHFQIYSEIKDSIDDHKNQEVLDAIESKYQVEKTEYEKIQLAREIDVKSSEIETNRMLLLILIILLVLVVLVFIQRAKNLRLSSKQKMTELDQRVLRAQINPHFLFNSLNSIQHFFLNNEVKKANKYLSDFGALMRNILDESTRANSTIEEEVDFISRYLSLEQARLNGKFTFDISVDENLDAMNTVIPTLILQPFVENSVWHGIAPNDKAGEIHISLQKETDTEILCTIRDNGIGVNASKIKNQGKKKNTINAIQITEERINLLRKRSTSRGKVSITELNTNGRVDGTQVTFTFPLIIR